MPNGDVKVQTGVGLTGLTGFRSQSSKSKFDGSRFVGPSTDEGRSLRKAFKGHGDTSRLLTKNPNALQVARHHQVGLFNLSSFRQVKTPPLQQDGNVNVDGPNGNVNANPPNGPNLPPIVNGDLLIPDIGDDEAPEGLPGEGVNQAIENVDALKIELTEWHDNRPTGRRPNGDLVRASIIKRDELNRSVEARLKELSELEARVRQLPYSEERAQHLTALAAAKREAALVALKLSMPGLADPLQNPTPEQQEAYTDGLNALAESLITLHETLALVGNSPVQELGGVSLALDKLIALLSNHGRIRELAGRPGVEDKTSAALGMTAFIDTIMQAVGPGRDGVELNGLLGLSSELDGVLKHLRCVAILDVLARDLAWEQGRQVEDLTDEDWQELGRLAMEVVIQDAEIAQCHQQLRRALEAAGVKDFNWTGSGVRVDTALIQGLREKFGGEARQVGLIIAGLKSLEQTARDSEGSRRLRQALERDLQWTRAVRNQFAGDYEETIEQLGQLRTQMALLDQEMAHLFNLHNAEQNEQAKQAIGAQHEIFRQQYEILLRQREDRWQQLRPLTELDNQIRHLEQRIESLTPEQELVRTRLESARNNKVTLTNQWNQLDEQLDQIDEDEVQIDDPDRRTELESKMRAIEERLRIVDRAIVSLQARWDSVSTDDLEYFRGKHREALIEANEARIHLQNLSRNLSPELRTDAQRRNEYFQLLEAQIDVRQRLGANEELNEHDLGLLNDDRFAGMTDQDLQARRDRIIAIPDALRRVEAAERELAEQSRLLRAEQRRMAAAIAMTGGLTKEELEQLGLTDAELNEVLTVARGLTKQGLSNTEQVKAICRDINTVVRRMGAPLTSSSRSVGNQLSVANAGNNEVQAERFCNELLRSLTGNVDAKLSTLTNDEMYQALRIGSDGLGGRLFGLNHALGQNPAQNELTQTLQQYGDTETQLMNQLQAREQRYRECLETVRTFPGRTIDPDRPQGLAVSRAFAAAVEFALLHQHDDPMTPEDQQRWQELARPLRGFKPESLELPLIQWGAHTPTMTEVLQWTVDHPNLMDTANAIIFLREQAPEFHREVKEAVGELDRIIDQRQQLMGPAGVWVRDAIRAAILHTLVQTGSSVATFRPAEHAEAIKNTLRDWGMPVDDVLPEINRALSESFGPDELNLWMETAELSQEYLDGKEQRVNERRNELSERTERQRLDPEVTRQLLDSVDHLQSGTKVKLFMGDRVEVQSGRINVAGIKLRDGWELGASVNAKLMVGEVSGLEVQRSSSDGYDLIIRHGWDGRGGVDFTAGGGVGGLKLEGITTLEASGFRVTGVAMRFPGNEAGRAALKETLEHLLTKGEIDVRDLSRVDNIMPMVERRLAGRFQGGVQARFRGSDDDVEGLEMPIPGRKVELALPSGIARIGAGVAGAKKWYTSSNTNLTVRKTDQDFVVEASASLNVYWALSKDLNPLPKPPHGNENPEVPLIGVDLQKTWSIATRVKTKQTFGLDGLVTTSTERHYQTTMDNFSSTDLNARRALVANLGGESYRRLYDRLEPEQREEIDRLIMVAGQGDLLNIGFALDERVRTHVNELLMQAKALRAGRIPGVSRGEAEKQAEKLEAEAQRMLDDENNYNPSKLQLIPTRETLDTLTALNLIYVRYERYVEDKSEWVAAEIRFSPELGRQVRSEMSTPNNGNA